MSRTLNVHSATIHDCYRIEVVTDHENGCVQILCYDENKKAPWHEFDLTIFGIDETPPRESARTIGEKQYVA